MVRIDAFDFGFKTQLSTQFNELKGNGTISTLQLHALLHFHLAPIKQVVYLCPHREF